MNLKSGGRFLVIAVVIGLGAWGVNEAMNRGIIGTPKPTEAKAPGAAPTKSGGGNSVLSALGVGNSSKGQLGSANNPLTVSLVSFHGYAPGLVANGDSLTTQAGSIYAQQGINVKFVIQDDVPTLTTIFEAKTAQCAWRTSDFWAQEQPNLRNGKLDAKAVMVVDNTRGADAIISKDPTINSVEDLAGKTVALLEFTPSHGMMIDALDNSSLTGKKKASVKILKINADEGTGGVRAAYEAGKVDAAALWDPDLSLALRSGGKVIYSTKTATNLIFDIMVCDTRVLKDAAGAEAIQKFVTGWMEGVTASKANPDRAVNALVKSEELFDALAKKEGKAFIKGLFSNLAWTGLADNVRILGMSEPGATNHYERVYQQFDGVYRKAGALANPNSPVIKPSDSFDYRFIQALVANDRQAVVQAAVPVDNFSESGRARATRVSVTKPVSVQFETGSATLSKMGKSTIDSDIVPMAQNNGAAYLEISGNTDSTGDRKMNQRLSLDRARVVADYLMQQWDVPAARLKIAGNGPDKPICNETNLRDEGVSLDECRRLNRATRTAVLGN